MTNRDDDQGVGIDGIQVGAYRWLADRVGHTAPILVVAVGIVAWCLFF
jgi:hypothetical protein